MLLASTIAMPSNAWAAPFTSGNFVAYRVGAESGAKSVYLDEYRVDGSLVQSVPLSSNTTNSLVASSTGSEGLLNRSVDGKCLTVPGYAAQPATADPKTAATRAVVFVGSDAASSTPTRLNAAAFSADAIRSAISDQCTRVWVSGAGNKKPANQGVWFINKDATGSVQLNTTHAQGITIDSNRLFVAFASGGTLNQLINTGQPEVLPVSGQPKAQAQTGISINNFRGIAFVKLNPQSSTADTLYLAANDLAPSAAIVKYTWDGSTWTFRGKAEVSGVHGLVAMSTGEGNVLLLATNDKGEVFRLFDTSGPQGDLSSTPLSLKKPATGESNYGLALAPEASPPAGVPSAPTAVKLSSQSGSDGTFQWSAPASGPAVAFYLVESSHDNFATIDQSVV